MGGLFSSSSNYSSQHYEPQRSYSYSTPAPASSSRTVSAHQVAPSESNTYTVSGHSIRTTSAYRSPTTSSSGYRIQSPSYSSTVSGYGSQSNTASGYRSTNFNITTPTSTSVRQGSLGLEDDFNDCLRRYAGNRGSSDKLTVSELETLMARVDRLSPYKKFQNVQWIYRDKPESFYEKAFQDGGVMRAYIKDHTGDKKSPINGKINGLFFATAQPPSTISYFGSKRIRVPASFFFSEEAQRHNRKRVRLYFADFYCMSKMHWVTIVLTYEGSPADRFCDGKLPELDINENDFIYVDYNGGVRMRTSSSFKTEIFYTADVDLPHWVRNGGVIETVHGMGTSSTYGKPKRSNCHICNL